MASDLFYGLVPEQLLLALVVLLMILEMAGWGKRLTRALFCLAAAGGCAVLLWQIGQGYQGWPVPGQIHIDRIALLGRLVILGCALVLGLSLPAGSGSFKSWMLLACSLLGALIIMDSAGFSSLFMGIEMLSLPAFALMVHRLEIHGAAEGAFKYLLLSAVASALILFGLSLAYGATGSLAIADFTAALATGGALSLAAGALVLSGLFLKAAVFPFHGWAPDAYAGAPLEVTAFLASVIKAAVVLALVRILPGAPLPADMVSGVICLALLSIFYGNITAIGQSAFKRLLAYSSIAHAGYMVFALADSTGGRQEALLYYVGVYAVTTVVACACFGQLCRGRSDELEALDGAFARRPGAAVLLGLCVLSLAGIPPLPGFLAKLFIFKSVIASGHLLAAVLAFFGSYLGVVYYLGIVYRLFRPLQPAVEGKQPLGQRWAWGGMIFGCLVLGLFLAVPGVFRWLLGGA